MTGHNALSLQGGHDNTDNISEEDNTFQDLGSIKKSDDLEDLTPDHGLNQWETAHPNVIRQSCSLSSLEDISKPTKPKAVKPIEIGSAVDLVAATEDRLTAEQKLKIEQCYGKVAKVKKARLPSITSFPQRLKEKGQTLPIGETVEMFNLVYIWSHVVTYSLICHVVTHELSSFLPSSYSSSCPPQQKHSS